MGSSPSKELKSKVKVDQNKNETIDFTASLKSTIYKHQIVYDGFFRMEILSHFQNKIIPVDIISLCYKFYYIDLKHLLSNGKQVKNILRAA